MKMVKEIFLFCGNFLIYTPSALIARTGQNMEEHNWEKI
jgi:hypothetical protein